MSILVTVLRVISEKLQNNNPKTRIICQLENQNTDTDLKWAIGQKLAN